MIGILVGGARIAVADEPASRAAPEPAAAEPGAVPPGEAAAPEVVAPAVPSGSPISRPPPSAYIAPSPAVRRSPPAWRPRDAHVAISLDQILSFDTVMVETHHDAPGDGFSGDDVQTRVRFPFMSMRSSQQLAVDGLFGGTAGVFFRFSRDTQDSSSNDPTQGQTDYPQHTLSSALVGVRGGGIIGRGTTVALWLRGGVGYAWTSETPSETSASSRAIVVAFDPVLIVAPSAHVALTVGPVLEGTRGSTTFRTMGVDDPGEHTWLNVYLRFVAGVSLMF